MQATAAQLGEINLWEASKWVTHAGKNLAHRRSLIKCLSNTMLSVAYRRPVKEPGQPVVEFWNSIMHFFMPREFLHFYLAPNEQQQSIYHKGSIIYIFWNITERKILMQGKYEQPWMAWTFLLLYLACFPSEALRRHHCIQQPRREYLWLCRCRQPLHWLLT